MKLTMSDTPLVQFGANFVDSQICGEIKCSLNLRILKLHVVKVFANLKEMADESEERKLLDAQKEALALTQAALLDQEKQKMMQEQQMVRFQDKCLQFTSVSKWKCTKTLKVALYSIFA